MNDRIFQKSHLMIECIMEGGDSEQRHPNRTAQDATTAEQQPARQHIVNVYSQTFTEFLDYISLMSPIASFLQDEGSTSFVLYSALSGD